MLRVWFGDRKNAIYNTSVFFKNRYENDWITDDFAINLFHVMDFGDRDFNIRILNDKKLITHNMQEFLTAGAFYLREGVEEDM